MAQQPWLRPLEGIAGEVRADLGMREPYGC
jgi:hypothetical protein